MARAPLIVVLVGLAGCGPDDAPRVAAVTLELRPDSPESRELFRFDDTEVVETLDRERVRVHFTRDGRNAVPPDDDDASGVPDYPELVAHRYDDYLARYEAMGFRRPLDDQNLADDNGGDGRFDIYLIDFFGRADGAFQTDACTTTCVGYAVQENDFAGYGYPSLDVATKILATHELFHAVQASYDAGQDGIFGEGTAVWATEQLEPDLDDFERFIDGYLSRPDRPLNRPASGIVLDPFNYGAALFFRFLTERFDDPDLIRRLLERVEDGAEGIDNPVWYEALDALLRADFDRSLSEAFTEFALWNVFTADRGDRSPGVGYAEATRYPPVAVRAGELPLLDERPRHVQLATRYYGFRSRGRDALEARLVGDADDLSMWLVVDRGSRIDVVSGSTVAQAAVGPGDEIILAVVNAGLEGPSRRASVCAGSPTEVQSCADSLVPEAPPPEDPPDDDPTPEDPPPVAEDPEPTPSPEGGCRSVPSLELGGLLLVLAGALGTARRDGRGTLERSRQPRSVCPRTPGTEASPRSTRPERTAHSS